MQLGPVNRHWQGIGHPLGQGGHPVGVHKAHVDAEGLGGAGVLVLHPRKAHLLLRDLEELGQLALHLFGGQPLFGQVDVGVLAIALGVVKRQLLHNKMVRRGPQRPTDTGQVGGDKGNFENGIELVCFSHCDRKSTMCLGVLEGRKVPEGGGRAEKTWVSILIRYACQGNDTVSEIVPCITS